MLSGNNLRTLGFTPGCTPGCPQLPVGFQNDDCRDDGGQDVRYGHGPKHAGKPEKARQKQGKPDAEHDLTHHGKQGGFHRFAHCLQKDEGRFVDAGEDDHAQVNAECADGEVRVIHAFVLRAENADQGTGKALDEYERKRAEDSLIA